MDVSVLVTTCADSEGLRRCLEIVRGELEGAEGELLLLVNAAPDALPAPTRAELEARADRVLFESRVGKSHCLNRGVAEARGRILAFTDDDAIPGPGWLEALLAPLREGDDPRLVGTGGRVIPRYPIPMPLWYENLIRGQHTHFLGPRHDLGPEPTDYRAPEADIVPAPLGANCAYRREVFEKHLYAEDLGPNRETGMRGGEDFELGLRLLREGHRLRYCPEAVVDHPVEPDRMERDYVRRAYFAAGVEEIRLRLKLGMPVPEPRKLRHKLRRRLPNVVMKPWKLRRAHLLERAIRHERHRGKLHELESLERARAAS